MNPAPIPFPHPTKQSEPPSAGHGRRFYREGMTRMTPTILADTARIAPRRIMIVSPNKEHDQPSHSDRINRIHQLFPAEEIVKVGNLFQSTEGSRQKWFELLRSTDLIVFFTQSDGLIDRASWSRLMAAFGYGIPIRYLTESGELVGFVETGEVRVERPESRRGRFVRIVCDPEADWSKSDDDSCERGVSRILEDDARQKFEADMRAYATQQHSIFDLLLPGITRNAGGR